MEKPIIPILSSDLLDNRQNTHMALARIPGPGDRDVTTVRTMMQYARKKPQSNLTDIVVHSVTRKTHVALVSMPKWAIYFAPYNLGRLAALTRASGYRTSVFDWNIETYHRLKEIVTPEEDPYHGGGATDYLWLEDMYYKKLAHIVEPLLEEYLEKLVELKPDVIGFSMYYTSVQPTLWIARRLRERLPNTKLICGGSQMQWVTWNEYPYPEFDCIVRGEGEELLLELLEKVENNQPIEKYLWIADKSRRINLDALPFPDYSDMDVNRYLIPNAISSELSRGCVAHCAFCPETNFWKYRSRQAMRILDEVEHQYKTYGTDVFWFIDSLVNGNINELRAFALGVVERGLKIKWNGYARCDERMDLEYLKDLASSGCVRLDIGIESGSERVLDHMKKNVTVKEVEDNMRDGKIVGIDYATQWMTCWANERATDIARSMTLAWRIQNDSLQSMARGTMNVGINEIEEKMEEYGLDKRSLFGQWVTKDFDLSKIHRLIRFKCFNIFIEQMPIFAPKDNSKIWRLKETYNVQYAVNLTPETTLDYLDMPYEDFDYEIIKDPKLDHRFGQTVVNEVWPLFRTLWRSRKKTAIEMSVSFDPAWDMDHFGGRLADNLTAQYHFKIDDHGNWTASCDFKFVQEQENPFGPYGIPNPGERTNYSVDLQWSGSGHWD